MKIQYKIQKIPTADENPTVKLLVKIIEDLQIMLKQQGEEIEVLKDGFFTCG